MESLNNQKIELKKLHEIIHDDPSILDSNDSSDSEEDEHEHFISTKEVENHKLEEVNRYLKLDLNNMQLKNIELQEQLSKEIAKNKINELNLNYTKECLQFLNSNYDFTSKIGLHNIMEYNKEVVDMARIFFRIEREYNKIKQYNNIEDILKNNYDILVTKKIEAIKIQYNDRNSPLRNIKYVMYMLYILIIAIIIILLLR